MVGLLKNNATSRLKINIPAASATITVLDGEGAKFPSPGGGTYFWATIEDRRTGQFEIVKATGRTGDIINVTRAQDGTAALDFLLGATVSLRITAAFLQEIIDLAYDKATADSRFVNTAGDTMTGQLTTIAPVSGGHAANKSYVDTQVASVAGLTDAPNDGNTYVRQSLGWVLGYNKTFIDNQLVGVNMSLNSLDSRLDTAEVNIVSNAGSISIKPSEAPNDGQIYGRQSIGWVASIRKSDYDTAIALRLTDAPNDASTYGRHAAAWTQVLPISGGTMTGLITLSGAPSSASHAATKAYVDAADATKIGDAPSDGNPYVRQSGGWIQEPAAAGVIGQCYLDLSGGNLVLSRYNGKYLFINGLFQPIPAAGVSLSPAGITTGGGLAGNPAYYIYAFMSSGTMTLEFSATAPAVDTNFGHKIKTGDATRTLVGLWAASASNTWSTIPTMGASWFNPRKKQSITTSNPATASNSFVELATIARVPFVTFNERMFRQRVEAQVWPSAGGTTVSTTMSIDGAGYHPTANAELIATTSTRTTIGFEYTTFVSEGWHIASVLGATSSGTTNWLSLFNYVETLG